MRSSSQIRRFPRMVLLVLFAMAGWESRVVSAQVVEGIYPQHLIEYSAWLDLDEEQSKAAERLYDAYWSRYQAEFLHRTRAYHSKMPGMTSPGYVEAYETHLPERREILVEMKRRDEAFFADLEAILRPDQRPRMRRVRYARQRQLWSVGRDQLPEGNVDLAHLVLQLDLTDDEEARASEILDWYEPQLLAELKETQKAYLEFLPLMHRRMSIKKSYLDGTPLTPERLQAMFAEINPLHERSAEVLKGPGEDLVDLNRRALKQFKAVLDEDGRERLDRLYREEAYPEAWPDPVNAIVLYQAAAKLDDLEESQRATVAVLRDQFQREHERLSERLAEALMDRRRAWRHGGPHLEHPEHLDMDRILEIGLEREKLNEHQIDRLRTILLPEQIERLPEWDFEKNSPDRPWDWADTLRRREQREQMKKDRIERARELRREHGRGR